MRKFTVYDGYFIDRAFTFSYQRYFGFPLKDGKFLEPDKKKRTSVHCKLCTKYAENTTNLRYHLEHNHRSEFQALQVSQEPQREAAQKRAVASSSSQQSITSAFHAQTPIPRSSPRWNKLTDAVCYFIAKDMQPISTVNDTGFRNMISVFESQYTPPDRKTLATHYLPKMFDTERKRILELVGSIYNFAIKTDLWTSRAKHAYTGLTIHYIMEEDFSLQSHLLATKEFLTHTQQRTFLRRCRPF